MNNNIEQLKKLQTQCQNLRDALIRVQAAAGAYRNAANLIPDSVNRELALMESECGKVLEENKWWLVK